MNLIPNMYPEIALLPFRSVAVFYLKMEHLESSSSNGHQDAICYCSFIYRS